MRATYVGGHELTKRGKDHPQAPPLHLHFAQSESFIVEAGAVGTTTTYDVLDTIHTVGRSHLQGVARPGLSPPVPSQTDGVTEIPPWLPHKFWPVAPDHPFWSTDEGRDYEASLPNGRASDTTLLIWGHPRTGTGLSTSIGTLTSDFPPDMDAAFFLALLVSVDAVASKRVAMTPALGAALMSFQTASLSSMIIAPTAWWLGPLRWLIPWSGQRALEAVRKLCGGKSVVEVVEGIIEQEVVKRQ
ncbi:uncharacterized protein DSM5745_11255 [Aspergillus mulundensis]|uniref:Uncharacterized protein n=1 Tax=Aspergillus mulundensis TaxID=1810919 RepID=A0A3D8QAQ9_9EURO|nr:Uncharacterized protein DSM5745_11255 [Aspergillus mulundensis]RDW58564.1 Uncharacterized protein DSM5745_11255 [Aspergillus mulundensis]